MSDVIRPLAETDARELLLLRIANRAFLEPFDPARPDEFFTLEVQSETARNADGSRFAILAGDAIAGMVSLSNISFGAFKNANVGYWVDQDCNGRGLASHALAEVAEHAFGPLGLHRLEAGTLVDNLASQRVLEKNGFERIGLARNYLHINGAWRDHILFQLIAQSG
jgi:[ribosomal protein S5]-alanine N-acetyltransferase